MVKRAAFFFCMGLFVWPSFLWAEMTYTLTWSHVTVKGGTLVVRYYQNIDMSDSTAWQTVLPPPEVTVNGQPLELSLDFSFPDKGDYWDGYDQFAQYYVANLGQSYKNATIQVTGSYYTVAYTSVGLYYGGRPLKWSSDQQFTPSSDEVKNPYLPGNPSVFSFDGNQLMHSSEEQPAQPAPSIDFSHIQGATPLSFYRYGADLSHKGSYVDGDFDTDPCSGEYLHADLQENNGEGVLVFRMKIPRTFVNTQYSESTQKVFGIKRRGGYQDYDVRYFSVNAQDSLPDQPDEQDIENLLHYWTVNTFMMNQYRDKAGYTTIFFLPDDWVKKLHTYQNLPDYVPPTIEWHHVRGYVLGYPSFAVLLRYKLPSDNWQGAPANATCYLTNDESLQHPVTKDQLGQYLPTLYQFSRAAFKDGLNTKKPLLQ